VLPEPELIDFSVFRCPATFLFNKQLVQRLTSFVFLSHGIETLTGNLAHSE
jgi:hypothetical protein